MTTGICRTASPQSHSSQTLACPLTILPFPIPSKLQKVEQGNAWWSTAEHRHCACVRRNHYHCRHPFPKLVSDFSESLRWLHPFNFYAGTSCVTHSHMLPAHCGMPLMAHNISYHITTQTVSRSMRSCANFTGGVHGLSMPYRKYGTQYFSVASWIYSRSA